MVMPRGRAQKPTQGKQHTLESHDPGVLALLRLEARNVTKIYFRQPKLVRTSKARPFRLLLVPGATLQADVVASPFSLPPERGDFLGRETADGGPEAILGRSICGGDQRQPWPVQTGSDKRREGDEEHEFSNDGLRHHCRSIARFPDDEIIDVAEAGIMRPGENAEPTAHPKDAVRGFR